MGLVISQEIKNVAGEFQKFEHASKLVHMYSMEFCMPLSTQDGLWKLFNMVFTSFTFLS